LSVCDRRRAAQDGERHRLADPLSGYQPVQFIDVGDRDAVGDNDDVAAGSIRRRARHTRDATRVSRGGP
jgi:hypothetical protein